MLFSRFNSYTNFYGYEWKVHEAVGMLEECGNDVEQRKNLFKNRKTKKIAILVMN